MEKLKFEIDQGQLTKLRRKEISVKELIESILFDPEHPYDDGGNFDIVCGELQSYHSSDGGAPEVNDFEIDEVEFNTIDFSGYFTIAYEVLFFWGCSDMNSSECGDQKWHFKIDMKQKMLNIETEDRPIRSTLEEF